jgi:hypothetical protein
MELRDISITEYDLRRLKELVHVGISFGERDRESLEKLQDELDRAHIVDSTAVPGDVVTMNSRVRFKDLNTNEDKVYWCSRPKRSWNYRRFRYWPPSARPFSAAEWATQWNGGCPVELRKCGLRRFCTSPKPKANTVTSRNLGV